MTADEAYRRLLAKGCLPERFFIRTPQQAPESINNDAIGLVKRGDKWEVFYTERGVDSPPLFTSRNEAEAAEFFHATVSSESHWHLVGFFKSEEEAKALEEEIRSVEIDPIRNDIPHYRHHGDRRYRVFVNGEDIFQIREFLDLKQLPHLP